MAVTEELAAGGAAYFSDFLALEMLFLSSALRGILRF
jgi:hypothetical protein